MGSTPGTMSTKSLSKTTGSDHIDDCHRLRKDRAPLWADPEEAHDTLLVTSQLGAEI